MGSLCSISNSFFQEENTSTIKGSNKTRIEVNQNHYLFNNLSKQGKRKYLK